VNPNRVLQEVQENTNLTPISQISQKSSSQGAISQKSPGSPYKQNAINNQNMNAAGIQNITLLQQQIAETLKRQEELLAQ
jgi:hypothetical protein